MRHVLVFLTFALYCPVLAFACETVLNFVLFVSLQITQRLLTKEQASASLCVVAGSP